METQSTSYPLVLFPDGSRLESPSTQELAKRAGLTTRAAATLTAATVSSFI